MVSLSLIIFVLHPATELLYDISSVFDISIRKMLLSCSGVKYRVIFC